ncbi:MAG: hypothetical protein HC901_01930, partial [Bdellovibrionaceae bacterium]|nr:hypothetical protein [Pseudobdellovibrionaceae bacterium]
LPTLTAILCSFCPLSAADDIPAQLEFTKNAMVEMFENGKSKGSFEMRAGFKFRPDGIENGKAYTIDKDGAKYTVDLEATNYQAALAARKSQSSAMDQFKGDAKTVEIKVTDLFEGGIASRETGGKPVFIAGVDPSITAIGKTWKGKAYLIGTSPPPKPARKSLSIH